MPKALEIIERVRAQLVDDGATPRWSDVELLRWLSDGQRAIALAVPSAVAKRAVIQLQEGTLQELPADAHLLLSVIRNMGADGSKPGRSVRLTTRELMDAVNPEWHSAPKSLTVENYVYDPQERTTFWVWPPSNGLTHVQVHYAYIPPELVSVQDNLAVSPIYTTALFDYVMFRAHQKDSEFAAGQALAQTYLQSFLLAIGARGAGEAEDNPNLQLTPFNPDVRGAAK